MRPARPASGGHVLDRLDRFVARRAVRAMLFAAALAGVYLQAHMYFLSESNEVDSYSYWFAAQAIAQHANPYDWGALRAAGRHEDLRVIPGDPHPPDVYPYVYPPPLAALWRVFLPLPPPRVHRILEVLGTLSLAMALVAMDRATAARRHRALIFAAFTVTIVANGPAVSSTRLGQVNAPLLASMAFAVARFRAGRDASSATALAAATLVKLTPVLLWFGFGGLFEPRGRRYALVLAGALAALVVVSLPWGPPVHWAQFVSSLRAGLPWRSELSLWGWLAIHGDRGTALAAWRLPLLVAGAAAGLACAWRHQLRVAPSERALEGAASAIVLGLLLSPLTWQHHYLFFMLPAWVWIARAWAEERTGLTLAFVALSVMVLLRTPSVLHVVRPLATAVAFALATTGPCGARARVPAVSRVQ